MSEIIKVDLEQDIMDKLVQGYVQDNLNSVSRDVFFEKWFDGNEIKDALYSAVLNQMLNTVVEQEAHRVLNVAKCSECGASGADSIVHELDGYVCSNCGHITKA